MEIDSCKYGMWFQFKEFIRLRVKNEHLEEKTISTNIRTNIHRNKRTKSRRLYMINVTLYRLCYLPDNIIGLRLGQIACFC